MKRKILSVLLTLVLVLSFSLVTAAPVAAAGVDWYVDASVGTSGGGTSESPFLTIQEGVNAADTTGGDTVNVAAGTYSTATNGESFPITIDTPLTLKGAQFGVDPTASEARTDELEESVIDASGALGNAIEIKANNVILEGFTIKNVANDAKYGIVVLPQSGDNTIYSSDITIQNNILTDNNRGMKLLDNENSLVKQNRIVNCNSIPTGNGGSGIVLSYVKPSTTITENLLTENVAGDTYYGPILVMSGRQYTQPTITKNLITNNFRGATGPSWGILVCDASAIIRDNIITENTVGGIWTMWGTAETPPILIENNEITGNALSGIEITIGTFEVSMAGNTISTNGGAGVNVQAGITTVVTLHGNSIFGNGDGVLSPTVAIDAEYNWWGDATGPGGVGAGAGDTINENVDYSPWCTDSGYTETSHIQVDVGDYVFNTIQSAIDAASSGDTINVAAGTYSPTSTIVIDKDGLILQGPQAGEDPRPSYGSTRIAGSPSEAIIDGSTGTLGMIIEVDADDVVINGLEVKSGTEDMIKQENPHSGTTVKYCIIHDGLGDEGVQLKKCTGGVLEYNYVFEIAHAGDGLNIADTSSHGAIRYNEVTGIHGENAAIYIYDAKHMEIISNLVRDSGIGGNDGIKVGSKDGTDAALRDVLVKDNIIHDITQDGISVYMSGVTVEGNEIYECGSENGAIYLAWAISDITIQNNSVHDNVLQTGKNTDAAGILIGTAVDASTVTINFNNIYNNNPYGVTNHASGIVDAENNYWGNASGPQPDGAVYTSYGDAVSTNVDYDPWLLKKVAADEEPTTYHNTLALKDGWTLVSTDKAVASSAWVGTKDLSPADTETVITVSAVKYITGFGDATTADLEPLTAIYVKTDGGGGVGFNYAADGDPALYSKDLEAGWNLISTTSSDITASALLSRLRYTTVGTQQWVGLTTLVSQVDYNQYSDSFYLATLTDADWNALDEAALLCPFNGYWADMEAADTFEVPIP